MGETWEIQALLLAKDRSEIWYEQGLCPATFQRTLTWLGFGPSADKHLIRAQIEGRSKRRMDHTVYLQHANCRGSSFNQLA